jgi:hypothetical protein
VNVPAYDEAQRNPKHLLVCRSPAARVQLANCRILMNRRGGRNNNMNCLAVWGTASCQVRNCQFVTGGPGPGSFVGFPWSPDAELVVENCLIVGHGIQLPRTHAGPTRAVLKRNTSLGEFSQFVCITLGGKTDPALEKKTLPSLQIEATANVFDGVMHARQFEGGTAAEKPQDTEKLLTRLVTWREDRNLYVLPRDQALLWLRQSPEKPNTIPSSAPTKTMADWKSFWGMDQLDSKRGNAKFQGGDLVAKAKLTPELLAPEDFRLRPDSDGYRAGKDGKDLGADVDLVGPGPAYERWKKTPEYQQWLKDTKQVK